MNFGDKSSSANKGAKKMKKTFFDDLVLPIKQILLAQIRDLWTHHSTALEGNALSLGDTAFILEEGLTIAGKPLKDHREVYDHARAIELVYRFLALEKITKVELFELHRAILTERVIDIYQPVGEWKNESNYTYFTDANNKQRVREYPAPGCIEALMQQWLVNFNHYFNQDLTQKQAVEAYGKLHIEFVTIHPFADGNGRMARLLANLPVLKSGFPPIVIPVSQKHQYKSTISAQQEKILNLQNLTQLNVGDASKFITLCEEYWNETIVLVDDAIKLNDKLLMSRTRLNIAEGDDDISVQHN